MDLLTWLWVWDERFINLLIPYFDCVIPKHKHRRVVAVWMLPIITNITFSVLSYLQFSNNIDSLNKELETKDQFPLADIPLAIAS
jgi:hypothetical protein